MQLVPHFYKFKYTETLEISVIIIVDKLDYRYEI